MHKRSDNDGPHGLSDEVLEEAREEFGRRLRELRKKRSWSQAAASKCSGVSQTEWSRVERALTNPSMTTLLRIQHGFEFDSVETLFGDAPSRRIVR